MPDDIADELYERAQAYAQAILVNAERDDDVRLESTAALCGALVTVLAVMRAHGEDDSRFPQIVHATALAILEESERQDAPGGAVSALLRDLENRP